MKKLLFVNDFAEVGGAEKALLDLIAGLDRKEFGSSVLLLEEGPLRGKFTEKGVEVDLIEFPQKFLRAPFNLDIREAIKLVKLSWGIACKIRAVARFISQGKYDFVITNSLKAFIVVNVAIFWGRRATQHLHYLHYILPNNRKVGTRLLSWFLSRTDCLICNSQATLDQAHWHHIRCKRTAIVRQGFDRATPIGKAPETREWIIGTAGRLSPVKNFAFIVDVASIVRKKHPNLRVYIAGEAYTDIDRRYEAALRRHIGSTGMEDVVSFEGFVDDMWDFMDSLNVFMLSSHTESFGRVLAEAMWSGKPIIATHVGAVPEIVQNEITGYTVSPGDVQAAANVLEMLIDRPDEAQRMGMSARRYAESNLSYRSYVAAWRTLLLDWK